MTQPDRIVLEKIELAFLFNYDISSVEPHDPLPWRKVHVDPFQVRYVPPPLADVCRRLSRRGPHGVYIDSVGGPDIIAELRAHSVPVDVVAIPRHGTGAKKCWLTPKCVFRFSEMPSGENE